MGYFTAMDISATGLRAEKFRLDVVSSNIANLNTTRTPEGGPYRKRSVVFQEALEHKIGKREQFNGKGVQVAGIVRDNSPFRLVYDPSHPDAVDGYVRYSNVDITREMVDLITATRAYEANVTAFNAAKTMNLKALEIGRI